MSGCLGPVAAALVDGELDHDARERAQRHLAHCADCRAEVDAHRSLKARLARLAADAPQPGLALTDRLIALQVPGTDRVAAPPGPVRPATVRPAAGPGHRRPRGRGPRRRTAVGTAVAALGIVALALGSPQSGATTSVDPATDSFVVEHVDTTSDVPRVVQAGFTGGGARSPR